MATGFKLSDGRDLSDIFTAGDAGLTVGFKTSNDVDLGRQFMGGSTGVVTGFRDPSGVDLGSRFGDDPWIAQGYTKATMLVGALERKDNAGDPVYERGVNYGESGVGEAYGSMPDASLIGNTKYKSGIFATHQYVNAKYYNFTFMSNGSKRTSVVINGVIYPLGFIHSYNNAAAAYNYFDAHVGQYITIYLK